MTARKKKIVNLTRNGLIDLIANIGPEQFKGLTAEQKRSKIFRSYVQRNRVDVPKTDKFYVSNYSRAIN